MGIAVGMCEVNAVDIAGGIVGENTVCTVDGKGVVDSVGKAGGMGGMDAVDIWVEWVEWT